ncbi:hypothetical protein PC123_g18034 [Phytophthora cactorum]|nr:hypothetical protein PC123_g18034 [Phytophthora cactorum]
MDPRRDYTVINVQEVDANPGDEYRAIEHHENRTSSLHVSGTYEDWIRPGYAVANVQRWRIAILLTSPRVSAGEQVRGPQRLQLRHPPMIYETYTWTLVGKCTIQGYSECSGWGIVLKQQLMAWSGECDSVAS